MTYGLDWPEGWDRTPEDARESTSKFSTGLGKTRRDIETEMDRLDVEGWKMDEVRGREDPGVVVRWRKDGRDHAVACDQYQTKKSNLRACYLWIKETRMRSTRPVKTGQDEFAAARLPAGDGEDPAMVSAEGEVIDPHTVIGVPPDATEEEIKEAARERAAELHPDQADDETLREEYSERFRRVQTAKKTLLNQ